MALVTSAEHYGALVNLDFNYRKYLEALASDGMNYTRIFTGSYFEIPGESFGIQNNTLAPDRGRVITPWKVVEDNDSQNTTYDLSAWNDAYFIRLTDFMTTAAEHDIIVEVTLFSSVYRDAHWDICPQNPDNNINIKHAVSRLQTHTMDNGDLFAYQENFVRKMVRELNRFDNFFFEIQNEPWSDHTVPVYNIMNKEELKANDWTNKADFASQESLAWQNRIAAVIVNEESRLARKHLIAQNYSNFKAPVPAVSEHISIINFHYAWPEAARWNYHYNRVIGFDESGFVGSEDTVYRRQAWRFMLSGGGLFNNLDYSFYVGHEDGTGKNKAPGGGGAALRRQLKILSDFLHSFDLERLQPNYSCVVSSPGLIPYVLSDNNDAFAVFLRAVGTQNTTLALCSGDNKYRVWKINTITGQVSDAAGISPENGILTVDISIPDGELALKILK
jgi:hypothetical protein